MSFISYAPNFEDVMLWRALRHVGKGFYIDAGAGGPDAGSCTRALYERGWHGVNLEPSRAAHFALQVARPADVNLQVVAGPHDATVTFYDAAGPASTLDEQAARLLAADGQTVVQRQLAQLTLSHVCAAHAGAQIHVMRIGAAGVAPRALDGLDLARWRPWVLVLPRALAEMAQPQLAAAGYEAAYIDGLDFFCISPDHPELRAAFSMPPSVVDDFILHEDHPLAYPLTQWRKRVASLEAALEGEQDKAQAAREWAEARVREHAEAAGAREQQAEAAAARERGLEAALAEASAHAARVEQEMRESSSFYEGTIQGIYHSWSWRLTRPLRSANFRAKTLGAALRRLPQRLRAAGGRLRRALAGTLKGAVRRAVRAIMSRPKLSYFVRSQIGRHPRLTNWLRVAVQRTQAPAPAPAVMEIATDPDHMPSSARQVLDDLRRTMNSVRHK